MKRRLFTILAALSLLLFVAVVVLWVRSRFVEDSFVWIRWRPGRHDNLILTSNQGTLSVYRSRMGYPANGGGFTSFYSLQPGACFVTRRSTGVHPWVQVSPTLSQRAGFIGIRDAVGDGEIYQVSSLTGVPHWFAALASLLALVWYMHRHYRSNGHREPGLCPSCGYDLRATPERCPECGAVPAAPPP